MKQEKMRSNILFNRHENLQLLKIFIYTHIYAFIIIKVDLAQNKETIPVLDPKAN